ncbi:haloacetate dehalogenase [Saccharothrix tamanrassetensis]|uniref:Haloacetate dehalogenase n=1 Tax=Saccharothrix tamanrassetensis TaxID=1051531 RepID=A0A841C6C4_9PSEU|nr:alpha/beta hydrolase [Saccharothrix tamanrassetensis]MBB5954092.1 haloacetate dehalogenase [Saccharothrix tamanrassetensis]
MFSDFTLTRVDTGGAELRVRFGGSGPPVLLLHGHPRTHTTWRHVAPLLARDHTVVCPDLPGYGESSKPPTAPDHEPHSKRATARHLAALMTELGHDEFAVVGHDRGGYVATRLALDHPDRVTHLVALDVVPIGSVLKRCGAEFARKWWHWFFLAQPEVPERVINADPDAWYRTAERPVDEDTLKAMHDPETVHAMVEDYRAGLGIDRRHDDADLAAGRRIACPVLVLWADGDDLPALYGDVLEVWREWTPDPRGRVVRSGHHLAEDVPDELAAAIREFVAASD